MKQFPWLYYSRFADGAFCHACTLFAPSTVGGQDPGQSVTLRFKTWMNKMVSKASTRLARKQMIQCNQPVGVKRSKVGQHTIVKMCQ